MVSYGDREVVQYNDIVCDRQAADVSPEVAYTSIQELIWGKGALGLDDLSAPLLSAV